jgi:hypothetical protein
MNEFSIADQLAPTSAAAVIDFTGSDDIAYEWRNVQNQKWQTWNPEQQGRAMEDYTDTKSIFNCYTWRSP